MRLPDIGRSMGTFRATAAARVLYVHTVLLHVIRLGRLLRACQMFISAAHNAQAADVEHIGLVPYKSAGKCRENNF